MCDQRQLWRESVINLLFILSRYSHLHQDADVMERQLPVRYRPDEQGEGTALLSSVTPGSATEGVNHQIQV